MKVKIKKRKVRRRRAKIQKIKRTAATRRRKHELLRMVEQLDPKMYDDAESYLKMLSAVTI